MICDERSLGVIVVDDDNLLSGLSSRADHATPLVDRLWCAAHISPAEAVVPPAVKGADVAALGVDIGQLDRFAEPLGTDADSVVIATAGDAQAVEPPTIAAQELTHKMFLIYIR